MTEQLFEDTVGYHDFEDRQPDIQYSELLQKILNEGEFTETQLQDGAYTLMGAQLKYDLRNGFPLITERSLKKGGHMAFAELAAFVHGVRTVEDLRAWGVPFWDDFVPKEKTDKRGLAEGDLGDGSYGAAYHDFPTEEGPFNQLAAIAEQIKQKPHLRTHLATTWVPQHNFRIEGRQQKTVWVPCHGTVVHFRALGDELNLHHVQRSADAPVGLAFNIAQYAALLLVMAKVTGHRPGQYIHTISDAHIYERQLDDVQELIDRSNRDPKVLPKVLIDAAITEVVGDINNRAWDGDSFKIEEYEPHPGMRIDTPND